MNLLLERVESPGSQRTAVTPGSRGVTLPDTLFRRVLDHLPIPPPFIPNCFCFTARSDGISESDSRFATEERVEDFGEVVGVGGSGHGGPSKRREGSDASKILITRITWACASSYSGRWTILCNGTPARTVGGVSRAQRADAKVENAAWRNDAIHRFWILTAERPAMYNLKRSELQAVLAEGTAVTDRVTNQLNKLTGFTVTDYMAEGDGMSAAGDMFLPEQMDVMVQSLLTVIGTGVKSDTGVERMQTLARAFHEGADTLRVHCRKHWGKLRISANKNIMRDLVNEDVKSWAGYPKGVTVARDRLPRRGRASLDQT